MVQIDCDGRSGSAVVSSWVARLPGSFRCGAEPVWHDAPRGWVAADILPADASPPPITP